MRSWIHSVKPLGDFNSLRSGTSGSEASPLPPLLETVSDSSGDKDGPLVRALVLLFEPSPVLYSTLVPALASHIQNAPPFSSYFALIDAALSVISSWPDDLQAQFIAGHPRIGQVKGLSTLSAQEQAAQATPPEILARLKHLNECYERRYPELVYITFVNGRSRAQIKDKLEDKLGLEHSVSTETPSVESVGSVEVGENEWKSELERAMKEIGQIAKSRLEKLSVDKPHGKYQ